MFNLPSILSFSLTFTLHAFYKKKVIHGARSNEKTSRKQSLKIFTTARNYPNINSLMVEASKGLCIFIPSKNQIKINNPSFGHWVNLTRTYFYRPSPAVARFSTDDKPKTTKLLCFKKYWKIRPCQIGWKKIIIFLDSEFFGDYSTICTYENCFFAI